MVKKYQIEVNIENATQLLDEVRSLSQLNGENPFRVRAYERASNAILKCPDFLKHVEAQSLTEIDGIGKGISELLMEFFTKGKSSTLEELKKELPAGLYEIAQVPGIGPKKARQIIDELGVSSVRDLEYACRENRLVGLKGFGEKAQEKILAGIEFINSTQGLSLLSDLYEKTNELLLAIQKEVGQVATIVGDIARKKEIVEKAEYLLSDEIQKEFESWKKKNLKKYPLIESAEFHFTSITSFGTESVTRSASKEHLDALQRLSAKKKFAPVATEKLFYDQYSLPEISAEMRETGEEVEFAKKGKLDKVLGWNDIQGVFHNHTNRSDGVATLDEMVQAARKCGYKYFGISDHSQSAFYANGLKNDALKEQEKEVRALQEKYDDIRIFWGIESDILQDGSLDYPDSVLKKFDFVVASVHQRFKQDRKTMTDRILRAIEHPSVRFLGHMTGRLLLGRIPSEMDSEAIIEHAAKYDVAIELNANPQRLDIDWREGPIMRKYGTLTSINPDAHSVKGLQDTYYGIAMARKGLFLKDQVVNSRSLRDVEKWLKRA